MPSIAQLLPLPGKDYERKCIELGIIRRVREMNCPARKAKLDPQFRFITRFRADSSPGAL
jgi:hypothetical protein